MIYYDTYASPIGCLLLLAKKEGLIYIEFEKEQLTTDIAQFQPKQYAEPQIQMIFDKAIRYLDRYFLGEKLNSDEIDFLHLEGTDFQLAVWKMLLTIPYGEHISYADIAKRLGKPNAVRAVGGAVGRNPISILVPCHRVLGKNLALTGFGGGLPAKRYLLQLEGITYQDRGKEWVKPKRKHWL